MSNIRVTIFMNATKTNGKVFMLPNTLEELKNQIYLKFNFHIKSIYNEFGGEIDDIIQIRDNDVLYVNDGEQFRDHNYSYKSNKKTNDWVTLNVGGKSFTTSKRTLQTKEPNSMLARMFAENTDGYLLAPSNMDDNGAYLIDRSPIYFEPVLNFLRNGQLIFDSYVNPEGILEEAKFFGIESIIPLLEQIIVTSKVPRDDIPLSRRDVINALIRSPNTSELRFQGVNLAGSDLSKLDLRHINFKFANLRGCNLTGCNLSYCYMERADLSHALLDGAQLLGVRCLCANMEGAQLRNCNFEDPVGIRAIMEGVNLKGANLEGSSMGGVNLRVATLKNANLKNCILRAAVFAGADLENCDLSGSDLHEANLRGANLKDAAFELMQTPLHMSQTIR